MIYPYWVRSVRAVEFTAPIRISRAEDPRSCSVEAVLDFCIRLGDECVVRDDIRGRARTVSHRGVCRLCLCGEPNKRQERTPHLWCACEYDVSRSRCRAMCPTSALLKAR